MKLCRDCKHCEPELYNSWFGLGPVREDWRDAKCKLVNYKDPQRLVTGDSADHVECIIVRQSEYCGPEGKLFEAKT
jgi:hypothetical protein